MEKVITLIAVYNPVTVLLLDQERPDLLIPSETGSRRLIYTSTKMT